MIDKYNTEIVVKSNNTEDIEFDFTLGMNEDEREIIKQFLSLREAVFESNPKAIIHIAGRTISVQNGNEKSFFFIKDGEIVPMEITEKIDLNFELGQREDKTENISFPPVKISKLSSLINTIKRKIHQFKTRNIKEAAPNYNTASQGKIVFSAPKAKTLQEQYKVSPENLYYDQPQKTCLENNHENIR